MNQCKSGTIKVMVDESGSILETVKRYVDYRVNPILTASWFCTGYEYRSIPRKEFHELWSNEPYSDMNNFECTWDSLDPRYIIVKFFNPGVSSRAMC